jgi:DNA end-binding protein Ku
MTRPTWTGSINFGLVTIPVKLYPAVREHQLHFAYLHKKDRGHIRYERVCTVCGKHVDWKDIARGYEYRRGQYVLLSDEDFEKASPEASHSVDILEFVQQSEIEPIFFDFPYYLVPDKRGRHAYSLLRDALGQSGKVGIARVVLRTREHLAALKPLGNALVVQTMHWSDEVVDPADLDLPGSAKQPPAEIRMATGLIDAMSAKFEPDAIKDQYRDRLMALIEARAKGHALPTPKEPSKAAANVLDLKDLLERSLARTKKHGSSKPKRARVRAA